MTEPSRDGRGRAFAVRRDGSILHLTGDIDQANWRPVAERVAAEVQAGAVELDLTGVGFFGAAAVRALLYAHAASPSGDPLRVTCSRMAFRVLTMCGLKDLDDLIVIPGDTHDDVSPWAGT